MLSAVFASIASFLSGSPNTRLRTRTRSVRARIQVSRVAVSKHGLDP
jgi:hypothetical protein